MWAGVGEARALQTRLQISTTAASGPTSFLFLSSQCSQNPPALEVWDLGLLFPVQACGSVSPACSEDGRQHQDSLAVKVVCRWTLAVLSCSLLFFLSPSGRSQRAEQHSHQTPGEALDQPIPLRLPQHRGGKARRSLLPAVLLHSPSSAQQHSQSNRCLIPLSSPLFPRHRATVKYPELALHPSLESDIGLERSLRKQKGCSAAPGGTSLPVLWAVCCCSQQAT